MMNLTKKMAAFAMAIMMGTTAFASTADAATLNWHLRFVKGAPTTENIYKWDQYVTTTQTSTTMKVSNMNSYAKVYVYTSNGISSRFESNGNTTVTGKKKDQVIYASATLKDYGSGTILPAGTLTY